MADKTYHRQYWKTYRQRKRQVSISLDLAEYRGWQRRAEATGRRIGRQILAEAQAHRNMVKLPTAQEETELTELIRIMRGIGNNLNQIAKNSNRFARLLEERRARQVLAELEAVADSYIHRGKIDP